MMKTDSSAGLAAVDDDTTAASPREVRRLQIMRGRTEVQLSIEALDRAGGRSAVMRELHADLEALDYAVRMDDASALARLLKYQPESGNYVLDSATAKSDRSGQTWRAFRKLRDE